MAGGRRFGCIGSDAEEGWVMKSFLLFFAAAIQGPLF